MTKFYRFMRGLCGWIVKILWPTKIIGQKHLDPKKTLLAINHRSNLDPVIAGVHMTPQLYFWGKQELFKNKILSCFFKKLGSVPVKRGEADISSIKAALTLLKQDKVFALFPEGTRNKQIDQEMLKIKHGVAMLAIKAQAPIRLAYYYRKPKIFRRNYLIIGDEFTLEQYYGQRLNNDILDEATNLIEDKFDALNEKLTNLLMEKGVIKVENSATKK